jgi:hypothetical protein
MTRPERYYSNVPLHGTLCEASDKGVRLIDVLMMFRLVIWWV